MNFTFIVIYPDIIIIDNLFYLSGIERVISNILEDLEISLVCRKEKSFYFIKNEGRKPFATETEVFFLPIREIGSNNEYYFIW